MAEGLFSQVRLYVRRQASSTARYLLEQTVTESLGWIPTIAGIGIRAVAYKSILKMRGVAAIEKGVPVPDRKPEPPKPPERAGHPLKPTLAMLAVGVALLFGLPPNLRVWGMIVTALGLAGLWYWFVAGRNEWRRQQVMEEEAHRAYVEYLKALALSATPGDGTQV